MEDVMIDIMYDLPELEGYDVIISKNVIDGETKPLLMKAK